MMILAPNRYTKTDDGWQWYEAAHASTTQNIVAVLPTGVDGCCGNGLTFNRICLIITHFQAITHTHQLLAMFQLVKQLLMVTFMFHMCKANKIMCNLSLK